MHRTSIVHKNTCSFANSLKSFLKHCGAASLLLSFGSVFKFSNASLHMNGLSSDTNRNQGPWTNTCMSNSLSITGMLDVSYMFYNLGLKIKHETTCVTLMLPSVTKYWKKRCTSHQYSHWLLCYSFNNVFMWILSIWSEKNLNIVPLEPANKFRRSGITNKKLFTWKLNNVLFSWELGNKQNT